jgi:hypothetical protein
MVNISDKFLTVTAFGYSLCLFLLALHVACARDWRRSRPLGAFAVAFVTMLGTFLFHVITGTALIATGLGAWVLEALVLRSAGGAERSIGSRLVIPLAALAAAAAGVPYFVSLGAGSGGGAHEGLLDYLHPGPANAATIMVPLILLAVPSWRAFRRMTRPGEDGALTGRWWIACLMLLGLLVDLPTRNESKLIYPLFLTIGPFVFVEALALISSLRGVRRKLLAAWVAVLMIPPPILTFRGFIVSDPSDPVDIRRAAAMADGAFFRWVEDRTPVDAVIAEPGHDHLMPVLARRRSLASRGGVLFVLGYDDQRVRSLQALQDSLFAPGGPGPLIGEMIEGSGLDLFVFLPRDPGAFPGGAPNGLAGSPALETIYRSDGDTLLRPRELPRREGDER